MNPAYQRVLVSVVTRLLVGLGTLLTTHGVLTQDEANALVSPTVEIAVGAIISLAAVGHGALRAWWTQQKISTAAASSTPMSEAQLDAKIAKGLVADPTTPKTEVPKVEPKVA
jgi:hypothetical protein